MKSIYFILIIFLNTNVFSEEQNDSHFYIDSDKLIITEQPLTSEFIGNAYARDAVHHFYGNRILVNYDNNKKIELINNKKKNLKTYKKELEDVQKKYNNICL